MVVFRDFGVAQGASIFNDSRIKYPLHHELMRNIHDPQYFYCLQVGKLYQYLIVKTRSFPYFQLSFFLNVLQNTYLYDYSKILVMKIVGKKYLNTTNEWRQIHHSLRRGHMKQIMKSEKSNLHFERQFPLYPIQQTWNHNNVPLHSYTWEPTSQPKAVLINFNALNAHMGLSGRMAQLLAQSGVITTGFDYPNFGKSPSPHPGHIQSVSHLIEISESYLTAVKSKYPDIPVFLTGVSMGGLIAFQVGLRKPTLLHGCVLLNPAFQDNPENNGFLKKIMMLGGLLFPKFQTLKPIRSHSTKHSLQKYKQTDKLMYTGKVWTSTTWALLSHMRKISKQDHFSEFSIPFLCIQGGSDKILNPFAVFELEKVSKTKDKQVVIIPNLWHAVWFDDHHDEVVDMVLAWILDRVQGSLTEPEAGSRINIKGYIDHHLYRPDGSNPPSKK